MTHNIDHSLGFAAMAFTGSRSNIWHRLGTEAKTDWTMQEWREAAGLNWQASLVPSWCHLAADDYPQLQPEQRIYATDFCLNVRSDTGHVIGAGMKDGYQNVQPADVCDYFARVCEQDSRFKLSTMGSLAGGSVIWGLASFTSDAALNIGGDAHQAHLLMSTSFDGSAATRNQMTMTRVVCENTIRAAWGDNSALVKTRHSTAFDANKVNKMLGGLAKSVERYKAIGDALLADTMGQTELVAFFKQLLDIPATASKEDISTRKLNCYNDIFRAWQTTHQEGAPENSSWTALQAVTRYVDHDRTTRAGKDVSADEARVMSSTFGSGDALKGQAVGLLMPRIRDRVLIAA